MQSICLDAEARLRDPKEVLNELIGDDLAWSGSYSMLIFADRCVKIQRNYELLLRQNKELSALYLEERSKLDAARQQFRQYSSNDMSVEDDIYATEGFTNKNEFSRSYSSESSCKLLKDLKELDSTKELLSQTQRQLCSQREYIAGLEGLVAASNRKMEQLLLNRENIDPSNKLASLPTQSTISKVMTRGSPLRDDNRSLVDSLL
jgi:hypothetical protein